MDVALREIHDGRIWRANAMRVVAELPDVVAMWSPRGSVRKLPIDADGAEIRIPRADWVLGERETPMDAVWLLYPDRRYSLGLYWVDGAFSHWYGNLERSLGRTRFGWDYVDHKLDLIAYPDGRIEWKDEDELAAAAGAGLLDEAEIRADAEAFLAERPWPTGWEDWQPDPAWTVPQFPRGWDAV